MTLDEFFDGQEESRKIFDAVYGLVIRHGAIEIRVSKSQIALVRDRPFAWLWMPSKYLHRKTVPLVLSIAFSWRNGSPRWKEIVEPYQGRFMHHLEISSVTDVDTEVDDWLAEAWKRAKKKKCNK